MFFVFCKFSAFILSFFHSFLVTTFIQTACISLAPSHVPQYCNNRRAVASGEASGARSSNLQYVPPITCLALQLLHTSNIVFKDVPPFDLWPPLLRISGDGPERSSPSDTCSMAEAVRARKQQS